MVASAVRQRNVQVGEVAERSDFCPKYSIVAREREKRVDQVITDIPSFIPSFLTTTVQKNWVEASGAVLHSDCIRPTQLDPSSPFCYDLLTQACALIQRQNSPINTNKKISPTKFTFSPISSLVRQVGSLFRQVGSLIRQSLRSQVSGSPLESRRSDRTSSSLPCSSAKFKIALYLSAQLERNAWQILAAVSSGGTLSPPVPCQVELQRLALSMRLRFWGRV